MTWPDRRRRKTNFYELPSMDAKYFMLEKGLPGLEFAKRTLDDRGELVREDRPLIL
jgi:hypothetical protein